ncbi:MAG: HAD-IA family hydrolase [Clostridia bacterium]
MQAKHLIWDFDGTLYDSYPLLLSALLDALEAMGAKNVSPMEALALLKGSVSKAAEHFANQYQLDLQALLERFESNQEGDEPKPYEGIPALLQSLHKAGYKHYLYSHRNAGAYACLEADGLLPLFEDGITSNDGYPRKPAPNALHALMRRNRLAPEACAMIGDRSIDISAGHNARMLGILFDPDGFYPHSKADIYVQSVKELGTCLLSARA